MVANADFLKGLCLDQALEYIVESLSLRHLIYSFSSTGGKDFHLPAQGLA